MRDITWPVPPMQNLGTYLNFPPPHCLFTITLYWAPMKNKGCLRLPVLNAKWSENFLSKNLSNFDLLVGRSQGVKVVLIFTPKGTSLRESTSFEPFWQILRQNWLGGGVWTPGVLLKKSKKVSDSHRKDMSPLTQGLNYRYRSACDSFTDILSSQFTLKWSLTRSAGQSQTWGRPAPQVRVES